MFSNALAVAVCFSDGLWNEHAVPCCYPERDWHFFGVTVANGVGEQNANAERDAVGITGSNAFADGIDHNDPLAVNLANPVRLPKGRRV